MPDNGFDKEWTEVGRLIAGGGLIGRSDLYAIYDNVDIGNLLPECLPGADTVAGKPSDRKDKIFEIAEKLWGLTPDAWLTLEKYRLREAREKSGSKETGGKDQLDDVISAEIMVRIVAVAKLVTEDKYDREVTDEAIRALNLILGEACAKGRTRMQMIDGKSIYSILKDGGTMIGTGGGKYLPNPEETLPFLLRLLHKGAISSEAYQK